MGKKFTPLARLFINIGPLGLLGRNLSTHVLFHILWLDFTLSIHYHVLVYSYCIHGARPGGTAGGAAEDPD